MNNTSPISKLTGPLVTISLISDLTREDLKSEVYRNQLRQVERSLQAVGVKLLFHIGLQESGDPCVGSLTSFTIETDTLASAGRAVIVAWMQAELGRKIRIRASDVEVEATNLQEAERLLETLKTFSGGYDEVI